MTWPNRSRRKGALLRSQLGAVRTYLLSDPLTTLDVSRYSTLNYIDVSSSAAKVYIIVIVEYRRDFYFDQKEFVRAFLLRHKTEQYFRRARQFFFGVLIFFDYFSTSFRVSVHFISFD